jgi:hypothetical protein
VYPAFGAERRLLAISLSLARREYSVSKKLFECRQYECTREVPSTDKAIENWMPTNVFRHSFIEDWVGGKLVLHLHFELRRPFGHLKTGKYCAHLYRFRGKSQVNNARMGSGNKASSMRSGLHHRYQKGTMLIPVIDGLKFPKKLDANFLPAVVRLEAFDSCPDLSWNAREMPIRLRTPIGLKTHKRKLDSLLFFPRTWLTERVRNVVERGSQVIRHLSDQEVKLLGQGLHFNDPQTVHMVAIYLHRASIELRVDIRFAECIRSAELYFRSRNLSSRGVQVRHDATNLSDFEVAFS